jgi:steroid 5-alpha reductase family enzyme
MNVGVLLGGALAAMLVLMAALWAVQRATRNAGIVDVAWSFGTGLLGVLFAAAMDGAPLRRALVGAMAGVWGLRLGAHLLRRIRAEPEDGRYRMLREQWGARTQLYMLLFFEIQATWAVLFALPMLIAARNPAPAPQLLDGLAVLVWLGALGGEAVADRQLARFRADPNPTGAVCREGLWRYSRHPNYFFEWLHWWAYVLLAWGAPYGWVALLGPVLMYGFLNFITGVPPTEQRALQSRGEAYRAYQRATNRFFPGPPREEGAS